jgi:hypothetical protein
MLGASGVYAQRRGAFIASPLNAGRPVVPAVAGTPGAPVWNPGPAVSAFHGHSHDHDKSPQIVAVPVPVPVIVDSGDPDPGPVETTPPVTAPPPVPPVPVIAAPAPAAAPSNRCNSPEPPEPPHILIALKNGWIYAAIAWWADGGTLHYVTPHGDHNQVSLELVDRKLSARLNQQSEIEFVLP